MFKYIKDKFTGTEEHKRKQIMITCLVGVLLLGIFGYVIYVVEKQTELEHKEVTKEAAKSLQKVEIETPNSKLKPEEIWRYKVENENEALKNDISAIKQLLDHEIGKKDEGIDSAYKALQDKIAALEQKLEEEALMQEAKENYALAHYEKDGEDNNDAGNSNIQKITLNLNNPVIKDLNNIANTIAAGSFAKATLLGGVDASTAMNASSDPRPILLRLIDRGTLPNQFKSKLKDCHIIASSYGDISSERVYGRLEKLSCVVIDTGSIIETQVAGYITGEDGRAGIRGTVVAKDTQMLMNSLGVGVLGGIGKAVTPQANLLNPFDTSNKYLKGPSSKDQFKQGFGEGASSALDRLSQYYIDKAENIQPVVQIAAGRVVDVVFTEGVNFGSNIVQEKLEERRKEQK